MHRSTLLMLASALGATLGLPRPAFAEEPTRSAREHFAAGYALADKGDAAAAIASFELAYAASPNPSVLYNLGQAYAAVGRSGEAVEALQRYLKLSGPSVGEPRIRQVEALIAYHVQRSGTLELALEPATAEVSVDGHSLELGMTSLRVNAGAHALTAVAPGFEAMQARVVVPAGEVRKLSLRLQRLSAPAQVLIRCPVEAVRVLVDGVEQGRTPAYVGGALGSGVHEVRLERAGYLPAQLKLELSPGSSREVPCTLRIDPVSSRLGALWVTHPEGTTVFLDGSPFSGGQVPEGVHHVLVTGPEHATETRRVTVKLGARTALTLTPLRAPGTLHAQQERSRHALRVGSYALAGVAAATAVAAVALRIDTDARYSAWQKKSHETLSTLPSDPEAAASLDQLLAEENDIRRRDSWALGLTVFSCTALATSAVLFLSSSPHRDRLIVTAGVSPGLRYEHSF